MSKYFEHIVEVKVLDGTSFVIVYEAAPKPGTGINKVLAIDVDPVSTNTLLSQCIILLAFS